MSKISDIKLRFVYLQKKKNLEIWKYQLPRNKKNLTKKFYRKICNLHLTGNENSKPILIVNGGCDLKLKMNIFLMKM